MAVGSVQYVIQCLPNGKKNSTAPCANVGNEGYAPSMVQAYLIEPSAAAAFEGLAGPFDYVQAGLIFSFFFSFVVGCWYVSKNIGLVLNVVKKW